MERISQVPLEIQQNIIRYLPYRTNLLLVCAWWHQQLVLKRNNAINTIKRSYQYHLTTKYSPYKLMKRFIVIMQQHSDEDIFEFIRVHIQLISGSEIPPITAKDMLVHITVSSNESPIKLKQTWYIV